MSEHPGFRENVQFFLGYFADVPEAVKVLKIGEEFGEASEAYIGLHGLNPRKGVTHTRDDMADELADVALTALVALGAFTVDPIQRLTLRVAYVADRARASRPVPCHGDYPLYDDARCVITGLHPTSCQECLQCNVTHDAGSSSGRTPGFGPGDEGSTPSLATTAPARPCHGDPGDETSER